MTIRRVIFLDIDGVLLPGPFLRGLKAAGAGQVDRALVDPYKVGVLNRVADLAGLGIVVSSSWRDDPGTPAALAAQGVKIPFHPDWATTHDHPGARDPRTVRAWQIQQWLDEHTEISAYAIIDDEGLFTGEHGKRFVQTSYEEGLMPRHVDVMRKALMRPMRRTLATASGPSF